MPNTIRHNFARRVFGAACWILAIPFLLVGAKFGLSATSLRSAARLFAWTQEPHSPGEWLVAGLGVVLVVGMMHTAYRAGRYLLRQSKRGFSQVGQDADLLDPRPPVIFLRSFDDDERFILSPPFSVYKAHEMTRYGDISLEELLEKYVNSLGPTIAIGNPGEWAPSLGARRLYVSDDWQSRVGDFIDRSRLVIFMLGKSHGLQWEFAEIIRRGRLEKVVLVVPPVATEELELRWERFLKLLPNEMRQALPSILPDQTVMIDFSDGPGGRAIYPSDGVRKLRILGDVSYVHYSEPFKEILRRRELSPTLKAARQPFVRYFLIGSSIFFFGLLSAFAFVVALFSKDGPGLDAGGAVFMAGLGLFLLFLGAYFVRKGYRNCKSWLAGS